MAELGQLQTETYLTQKDVQWIAGAFRELAPQVRNLGGKIFGGKVQWIRPQSDEVFAVLDEEPEFAANAFFPVARGYKARNESVGYTIKIAVWDEGERRRISIGSQASRQADRPQASGARRRLVRMLTEVDDTLTPDEPEGGPTANGSVLGNSAPRQQRPRSVARPSRRAPKLAITAALTIVLLIAAWITTARSSSSEPTGQQATGAPAPTAVPAGNGSAKIPEAFLGTWVGTGYQYDTQSRWTIRMTLRASGQATAAGRITYPSLAAGPGSGQEALLDGRVGDQGSNRLGQDGAFLLQPGHDAQDLLGLIQPKLLWGDLVFEEAALGSLGFFRVAEQHHQIAGGPEVPRAQGSFGWLLQRPVVWLGHGDHPHATGAESTGQHTAVREQAQCLEHDGGAFSVGRLQFAERLGRRLRPIVWSSAAARSGGTVVLRDHNDHRAGGTSANSA